MPQPFPVVPQDQELGAEISARLVNLTPHVVRLLERKPGGGFYLLADLEPSGTVARVQMTLGQRIHAPLGLLDADITPGGLGLDVRTASEFGQVIDLPPLNAVSEFVASPSGTPGAAVLMTRPPERQPRYIVSTLVAQALRGQGRWDVYSPGTSPDDIQRGPDGQIYGVYALEQAPQ